MAETWLSTGTLLNPANLPRGFRGDLVTQLFENVYRNDSLKFWANHGVLDYEKVRDFVGLDKTDLSRVAHVKKASVRFDERIPLELKERLEQIANCCLIVAEHFKGDAQKTATWFRTANPLLGNLTPRDMIRYGRFQKLQRFILEAVAKEPALKKPS